MEKHKANKDNGRDDFWSRYKQIALESKVCPQRGIGKLKKTLVLELPINTVRSEHWPVFLEALSKDNSLKCIRLYSYDCIEENEDSRNGMKVKPKLFNYVSDPVETIIATCKALSKCFQSSKVLKVLRLEHLSLTSNAVKHLTEGLAKNTSLQQLSFERSTLDDDCISLICRCLRNASNVEWIDFQSCNLTLTGIQSISCLLKFQCNRRHVEVWPRSLRYSRPDFDAFRGLCRVTLNNNPMVTDDGAKIVTDTLTDDLFFKALDLQNCNISDKGGILFLQLLKANCMLEVIDVQFNSTLSDDMQKQIKQQLELNNCGKILKYDVLPPYYARETKVLQKHKTGVRKHSRKFTSTTATSSDNVSSETGLRQGTYSLQDCRKLFEVKQPLETNNQAVQVINSTGLISDSSDNQMVKYFNRSLKKLKRDNKRLKRLLEKQENFTFGQSTLLHILEAFEKFEKFLLLMNEAGLKHLTLENPNHESEAYNNTPTESQGQDKDQRDTCNFRKQTTKDELQAQKASGSTKNAYNLEEIQNLFEKVKDLYEQSCQPHRIKMDKEVTATKEELYSPSLTQYSQHNRGQTQYVPCGTCSHLICVYCQQILLGEKHNQSKSTKLHLQEQRFENVVESPKVTVDKTTLTSLSLNVENSPMISSKENVKGPVEEEIRSQSRSETVDGNDIWHSPEDHELNKEDDSFAGSISVADAAKSLSNTPHSSIHSKQSPPSNRNNISDIHQSKSVSSHHSIKESQYEDSFEGSTSSLAVSSFSEIAVSTASSHTKSGAQGKAESDSILELDINKSLDSESTLKEEVEKDVDLVVKEPDLEFNEELMKNVLDSGDNELSLGNVNNDEDPVKSKSRDDKSGLSDLADHKIIQSPATAEPKFDLKKLVQNDSDVDPNMLSLMGTLSTVSSGSSINTEDIMHYLSD